MVFVIAFETVFVDRFFSCADTLLICRGVVKKTKEGSGKHMTVKREALGPWTRVPLASCLPQLPPTTSLPRKRKSSNFRMSRLAFNNFFVEESERKKERQPRLPGIGLETLNPLFRLGVSDDFR